MSHMCNRIFEFELQLSSYWQNIKFSRYCPKFHIFTKIIIFQVFFQLLDQLLHPYKFYGRGMSGILFFIFASCEPLIRQDKWTQSFLRSLCEIRGDYFGLRFFLRERSSHRKIPRLKINYRRIYTMIEK